MTAIKRRAPIQLLSYLIRKNVNKSAVNDFGQSAAHLAVEENYTAAIEILVISLFNFSLRDKRGRTALIYAIELERVEAAVVIIKRLSKSPVLTEATRDSLDTPLHLAAMKPSTSSVVRQLMNDPNVNVSAVNANHETALHKAVAYLNLDAVKLLMEKSSASSLSLTDNQRRTPLHLVALWCNSAALEIGRLLLASLPTSNSRILQLVDIYGNTPLDLAIRHNCLEMVDVFMTSSSNQSCQVTNSRGLTSWQHAISLGYESLAEVLVKRGRCTKQPFASDCENLHRYFQCGDVPVIDNGVLSYGPSCVGSKRNVSCKSGYRLTGLDVVECNSELKWIVRGYCEEIRCRDEPVIQHGTVSNGLCNIGAERKMACKAGFNLIGSAIVKCGSDAKWIVAGYCQLPVDTDCESIHSAVPSLPSGIYTIYPPNRPAVAVYCDMTYLGGGWTVFQRRVDGSQNFFLTWADYKKGFGNLSANFWLGNDNIHAITSGQYEYNLIIALTANNGTTGYALYDGFRIEDEASSYTLRYRSFKVNGGIGDSLSMAGKQRIHKDMKFSTVDSDNDLWSNGNCAEKYKGAWWFKECHDSDLNGVYGSQGIDGINGIGWFSWRNNWESMKRAAMMIRRSPLFLPIDCESIHSADLSLRSGIYTIYPPDRPSVVVYCDMTYLGGGWTVFQRRVDGSQDFNLKWADYKKGFGNLHANFWLGNDNIHAITSGNYEYNLLIALTANNGATGYALYDGFRIEDEANGYTLRFKSFKENGNNINDSLTNHKDMKFTTIDRDNDSRRDDNCAGVCNGAWWFNDCHRSNLNGVYGSTTIYKGVEWQTWRGPSESMKTTTMMIRRLSL